MDISTQVSLKKCPPVLNQNQENNRIITFWDNKGRIKMAEKTVKYEYEYGLCKRMHYRGLWCVRYEGVPGHMEKVGLACAG